ncbi:hypothetical protein [Lacinutrix sp. MEBiC02404]
MLYIKFNIQNASKYLDFQKLYAHMVETREPGFNFQDDESAPEMDWDSMKNEEEMDEAVKELNDYLDQKPEFHRYHEKIPNYANDFLESYLQYDNEKSGYLGEFDPISIFNYLECGFEVDLDSLEKHNEKYGIVRFSTGNYPFGGLERFFITLKAYEIIPLECYDGFTTNQIKWLNNFEYKETEFPKRNKGIFKFLNFINGR